VILLGIFKIPVAIELEGGEYPCLPPCRFLLLGRWLIAGGHYFVGSLATNNAANIDERLLSRPLHSERKPAANAVDVPHVTLTQLHHRKYPLRDARKPSGAVSRLSRETENRGAKNPGLNLNN
jgi:hypothetical protein